MNRKISTQTRNNWLIDTAVFIGALLSMLSGLYFLYLPSGGYEGGRNPWYGVVIIWARDTWEDLHLWGGLLMIAAVVIHLVLHWSWVVSTTRRVWQTVRRQRPGVSRAAWSNVIIDGLIALSFLVTAVSGLYFYLFTEGGSMGGNNPTWDPGLLFTRPVWDLLHTWGGVVLIAAAVLHIFIHWRWIVNVTRKVWLSWQPVKTTESAVGN